MLLKSFFIYLLFASAIAFADQEKAVEMIKGDLRSFVKKSTKEIYSYHWKARERFKKQSFFPKDSPQLFLPAQGVAPLQDKNYADFVNHWTVGFNNHTPAEYQTLFRANGHSKAGFGFYTSVDPMQSRDFGKYWDNANGRSDPTLVEVKIRSGLNFLDLRSLGSWKNNHNIPLSKETYQYLLNNLRCSTLGNRNNNRSDFQRNAFVVAGKTYHLINRSIIAHNRACHQVLKLAFEELSISFAIFDWNQRPQTLNECLNKQRMDRTNYQGYSLVFINHKFEKEDVNIYVSQLEAQPNAVKRENYLRIHSLITQSVRRVGSSGGTWPRHFGQRSSLNYNKWINDHLITCGDAPEDRPH